MVKNDEFKFLKFKMLNAMQTWGTC